MTSDLEDGHSPGTGTDEAVTPRRPAPPRKRRDPIVGALITTILLIIVLTLVTVVYALLTGVFGTGAPRTAGERRIMAAQAKIEAGSKVPKEWNEYILALIDDGQYRKAQEWIDKGKKTLKDQEISADMIYMQAELQVAQGKIDEGSKTADLAMKTIKDRYEQGKASAAKSGKPDKASAFGIDQNYYDLLLLKAEIYENKKDWAKAVKAYDEFLGAKETAATVFVQRGAAKEKLGDKAGAESDFRRALVFIPDNPDALAGLERIGVAK